MIRFRFRFRAWPEHMTTGERWFRIGRFGAYLVMNRQAYVLTWWDER